MIGKAFAHYEIRERIGAGGMGEVYRAHDTHLLRDVAVKILPPGTLGDAGARRRFRKEALALSQLSHPNIATVHDFDTQDGVDFLVMELIEGKDLGAMIAERRSQKASLDETECVRLGDQIAAALDEAHQQGVIHRDLKPQNIMVTPKGQVKVLDFGLAKLTRPQSGDAPTATMTQAGAIAGTLPYMAPEQVQGLPTDARVDLYAWGATMYELATGMRPFGEAHGSELIAAIVRDIPRSPRELRPEIAPWLDTMIGKALRKDPSSRQQSISEIRAEIAQRYSGVTPAIGKPARRAGLRRNLAIGIPALLLIGFVGWGLRSTRQTTPTTGPSVAILPFENVAETEDPNRLGEIVGSLLTTSLVESRALTVISRERLLEVLRGTGEEDLTTIQRSAAMEVARKAGSKTILLGEILQVAPRYIVTSQLVSLDNGEILATQRVDGEPGQDVFAVVEQLARTIRTDLGTPDEAVSTQKRSLSQITSTSLEAQRHFLDGMRYRSLNYPTKSRQSFRRAIEADSTFALAYLYLGQYDAAVRHSAKAPTKDQRLIRVTDLRRKKETEEAIQELEKLIADYPQEKEYYRQLFYVYFNGHTGFHDPIIDTEKALQYARIQVELDPLDGQALHLLFYAYFRTGDWENSLRTLDRYVALGEANAYDDLGDFYAWRGRFAEAVEPFRTALEINPIYTSLVKAGFLHLKLRDYEQARENWRRLATHEGAYPRKFGKRLLLVLPMYQGRLSDALEQANASITAAELVGEAGAEYRRMLVLRSQIFGELGQWGNAVSDCERAVASLAKESPEDSDWNWYIHVLVKTLAASGHVAGAEALIREKGDQSQGDESYTIALSQLELARGDPDAAYALLKPLAPVSAEMSRMQFTNDHVMGDEYLLALACLESGRLAEAVEHFQSLGLQYYGRVALQPIDSVRAHYYLALAYERSGWTDKAAEEYRTFLDIWSDADPGLRFVEDARTRLASLES